MTDLGIGETDEEKTKIKEKHLKRIKKISKDLEIKESDFKITEEQKRAIQKLEAKEGKVVVLHYDKVISVLEGKAETSRQLANYRKDCYCFRDVCN